MGKHAEFRSAAKTTRPHPKELVGFETGAVETELGSTDEEAARGRSALRTFENFLMVSDVLSHALRLRSRVESTTRPPPNSGSVDSAVTEVTAWSRSPSGTVGSLTRVDDRERAVGHGRVFDGGSGVGTGGAAAGDSADEERTQ
jgi:hypothetical protein